MHIVIEPNNRLLKSLDSCQAAKLSHGEPFEKLTRDQRSTKLQQSFLILRHYQCLL